MICDNSEYIEVDGVCYRKNVGIIVYNCEGKVLICERNQEKIDYKWQFPQGGVDTGEKTDETVLRELFEETGIKNAKIVFKDNVWRAYKFPAVLKFSRKYHDYYKNVKGQIQTWFLVEFCGDDSEIKIPSEEFTDYKWVKLSHAITRKVVPFKKEVYKNVIKKMIPILNDIMKSKSICKKCKKK